MEPSALQNIPAVIITPQGIFKYILIQVFVANKVMGHLVRGSTKFEYHAQNYKNFVEELKKLGFQSVKLNGKQITGKKGKLNYKFVCLGGGRIQHNYQGKKCSVYGYSKTYGKVNHKIAQQLIAKHLEYPEQQIILNQKEY